MSTLIAAHILLWLPRRPQEENCLGWECVLLTCPQTIPADVLLGIL